MKLRENWKRFWTLSRHHEGFTLVELIVVIAILAILAGVGVPAYSGYVSKANMTADQALVSEVKNALELGHYSGTITGNGYVVLTTDGLATIADPQISQAIQAVFGDTSGLVLKYDGWPDAANANFALENFRQWDEDSPLAGLVADGDGKIVPVFADDVDELYDLIETTATGIGSSFDLSGAELIKGAAGITATDSVDPVKFATDWASGAWNNSLMNGGNYSKDDVEANKNNSDFMSQAVANAGVIKARNTSLAIYLRDVHNVDPEICSIFENLTYSDDGVSGVIPVDPFSEDGTSHFMAAITEKGIGQDAAENAIMLATSYFGWENGVPPTDEDFDYSTTQAYKDAIAYYGMMDTINYVDEKSGGNTDDETYWDSLRDVVSTYGQIAQGNMTLDFAENIYGNIPEGGVAILINNGVVRSTIDTLID